MEKKVVNRALVSVVIVALLAVIGWLGFSLKQEKQTNQDMQQLAELDKQEMEKEYQNFALQYNEMKTYIKNDSIIAELTREQEHTQKLLEELKRTHASDAAEITRLKKELATVRAVLRSYVIQIDSLNRLNQDFGIGTEQPAEPDVDLGEGFVVGEGRHCRPAGRYEYLADTVEEER